MVIKNFIGMLVRIIIKGAEDDEDNTGPAGDGEAEDIDGSR